MAVGGKITKSRLKTQTTNLVTIVNTVKTNNSTLDTDIKNINSSIDSINLIRAVDINKLGEAINNMEKSFSLNCCQSKNSNCQCNQCSQCSQCSQCKQCKNCTECSECAAYSCSSTGSTGCSD